MARRNLSPAALARVAIVRRGAVSQDAQVPVRLPNGEVRNMAPGPSSQITKAVLEEFVPRFLVQPGLIWLSESGNQVVAQDDELARAIGLTIEPDLNLPDLILVDLKADGDNAPDRILLVFVEVVATAGAVSASRREALLQIATDRPSRTGIGARSVNRLENSLGSRSVGSRQNPTTSCGCTAEKPSDRRGFLS